MFQLDIKIMHLKVYMCLRENEETSNLENGPLNLLSTSHTMQVHK